MHDQLGTEKQASYHTYIFDPENVAELARLEKQAELLTLGMGGVLPEWHNELPDDYQHVLDMGCGPGEWVRRVASNAPHAQVNGVDVSTEIIAYAQMQTQAAQIQNAHFVLGNLLEPPLPFPDDSFDLVNERILGAVLRRESWPGFLRECLRLTRTGGLIRVTEPDELWRANQPAWDRMSEWNTELLHRSGYGFATSRPLKHVDLTAPLFRLLGEVGWTQVDSREHIITFQPGSSLHEGFCENAFVVAKAFEPIFLRMGITTKEEFQEVYEAYVAESTASDFQGFWRFCTLTARKP